MEARRVEMQSSSMHSTRGRPEGSRPITYLVMIMSKAPTRDTYLELQSAYDFFNNTLFENRLPPCLITLQREKHTYGYFSSNRFVERSAGDFTDEIAMNPSYFGIRTIEESLSTLVHEMTHLEQQHFGKPGRGRYHNKEWGKLMLRVGLHPSNTGKPGGKMTGDQMTHYIISGGVFEKACAELITTNFTLSWIDRFPPIRPSAPLLMPKGINGGDEDEDDYTSGYSTLSPEPPAFTLVFPVDGKETRTKYVCPLCQTAVWGKKNLVLLCGSCESKPSFVVSKKKSGIDQDI